MVSLRMPSELVHKLHQLADQKKKGYQTLIREILQREAWKAKKRSSCG